MIPAACSYTDLRTKTTLEIIISRVLLNPAFAWKALQHEANVGFKDTCVA